MKNVVMHVSGALAVAVGLPTLTLGIVYAVVDGSLSILAGVIGVSMVISSIFLFGRISVPKCVIIAVLGAAISALSAISSHNATVVAVVTPVRPYSYDHKLHRYAFPMWMLSCAGVIFFVAGWRTCRYPGLKQRDEELREFYAQKERVRLNVFGKPVAPWNPEDYPLLKIRPR